ncbi:MAG: hypothetical protein U1E73_09510 [Planctomycetota bacterium]
MTSILLDNLQDLLGALLYRSGHRASQSMHLLLAVDLTAPPPDVPQFIRAQRDVFNDGQCHFDLFQLVFVELGAEWPE